MASELHSEGKKILLMVVFHSNHDFDGVEAQNFRVDFGHIVGLYTTRRIPCRYKMVEFVPFNILLCEYKHLHCILFQSCYTLGVSVQPENLAELLQLSCSQSRNPHEGGAIVKTLTYNTLNSFNSLSLK